MYGGILSLTYSHVYHYITLHYITSWWDFVMVGICWVTVMMMMMMVMMSMDPPIVKKGDESSRGVEELREQDGATRRAGNLVEDEI